MAGAWSTGEDDEQPEWGWVAAAGVQSQRRAVTTQSGGVLSGACMAMSMGPPKVQGLGRSPQLAPSQETALPPAMHL